MKFILIIIFFLVLILDSAFGEPPTVLVELFTDQNCQQCGKVEWTFGNSFFHQPDNVKLIPMVFHLPPKSDDLYSNHFSQKKFSQRFERYLILHKWQSSLPTIVVQGRKMLSPLDQTGLTNLENHYKKKGLKSGILISEVVRRIIAKEVQITFSIKCEDLWITKADSAVYGYTLEPRTTANIDKGPNKGKTFVTLNEVVTADKIGEIKTGKMCEKRFFTWVVDLKKSPDLSVIYLVIAIESHGKDGIIGAAGYSFVEFNQYRKPEKNSQVPQ